VIYQRFGGTYFLHLQALSLFFAWLTLGPWRWRQYISSKRLPTCTRIHGAASHKMVLLRVMFSGDNGFDYVSLHSVRFFIVFRSHSRWMSKKYLKLYDRVLTNFLTSYRILTPEIHAAVYDSPGQLTCFNNLRTGTEVEPVWTWWRKKNYCLWQETKPDCKAWLYTTLAELPS
jgi:hypothetical protein